MQGHLIQGLELTTPPEDTPPQRSSALRLWRLGLECIFWGDTTQPTGYLGAFF